MASTTERPRTPAGQSSRRALLASAALVAPASLLPAIAAAAGKDPTPALPEPDAELLALARRIAAANARSDRRWRELEDEGVIGSPDEPVIRAAVAEIHACIEEIGRLPARSPAGLLVKARIMRDEVLNGSTMCADGVAESLVEDLERLAGEARHV
jgi:hypothetical protein